MKSSYPFGSSPNLELWHHHRILKTHIRHYDLICSYIDNTYTTLWRHTNLCCLCLMQNTNGLCCLCQNSAFGFGWWFGLVLMFFVKVSRYGFFFYQTSHDVALMCRFSISNIGLRHHHSTMGFSVSLQHVCTNNIYAAHNFDGGDFLPNG